MMKIELLYFDGCPNYEALLPELRELLGEQGIIEEEVELRRVETVEDAERERFLGSPTVRIDGSDVEPRAAERDDYGLKCRLYRLAGVALGAPPRDLIAAAIRSAREGAR
jgi:hypothetical protein